MMRFKTTQPTQQAPSTNYATTAPVVATLAVATPKFVQSSRRAQHGKRLLLRLGLWVCFLVPVVVLGSQLVAHRYVRSHAARKSFLNDPIPKIFCEIPEGAEGKFFFGTDTLTAGVSEHQSGGIVPNCWTFELPTGQRRFAIGEYHRYCSALEQIKARPIPTGWSAKLPPGTKKECLVASQDGRYVAMSYTNGILIWESATGKLLKQIKRHNSFYQYAYLQFSPDSRLLGDAYADGIALWDWQ